VRYALGGRATLEAPARARAAAEAAARERRVAPRRGEQQLARTEKQLAYERRRRQQRAAKQMRAAKLLGQGMTQQAVAAELGVTTRTLRNWKAAPAFQRERQHKQAARQRAAPPSSKVKPRARRDAADKRRDRAGAPRPAAQAQPERPPAPPGQQQTIADAAGPPRSPSTSEHDGVPIFPDTPDGRAARLAYYEARKLNNLPTSLYDYHDAMRGREPPAERSARERRDNRAPR
jgi:DNA-binding transcriptional regulator YiaG